LIVQVGRLTGRYREIFEGWDIVLLDNVVLDAGQRDFVFQYLQSVPADLHDVKTISLIYNFGKPPIPEWENYHEWLAGANRHHQHQCDTARPSHWESVPDDVAPAYSCVFIGVLAHELNHVVNGHTIEASERLRGRQQQLISDAGRDHYELPAEHGSDGFFADARRSSLLQFPTRGLRIAPKT